MTPLMRPTFARLLLTYVLPLIPLVSAWDGVVSSLRSYTEEELRLFVADLDGDDYRWEVGRIEPARFGRPAITYLLGWPSRDQQDLHARREQ